MPIGVPDVPATRGWDPWGDHYLNNEWRANGCAEQTLWNVVQGLQFKPNGDGLAGHEITPGVAYLFGYRVKYVGGDTFDFVADNWYTFWAKLNLNPDLEAGYDDAYITIEVQNNAGSIYDGDPPSGEVLLLGWIKVDVAPPYLVSDEIHWCLNFSASPEIHEGDGAAYTSFHTFSKEILAPCPFTVWSPTFYYKMNEGTSASLQDESIGIDLIDPAAGTKYVRPVKARNKIGQLFDAYLGTTDSYRVAVNPALIKAEGAIDVGYLMSIWAYPFRDDVDMYLMYKDQDFYLKWITASKVLEFKVGDGLGSMVRFVQSQTITSFKDAWFHIMFGYNNITDKHYIVVNDEVMQIEIGGGARDVAATDFYLGSTAVPDENYYGILDEFCKFESDGGYHRLFIHEFYNKGIGLTYIGEGEGNRKSLIQFSTYGIAPPPSIGSGAEGKINFGNALADPGNWLQKYFDIANNRFITPRDGIFMAYAKVGLDDPIADGHYHIEFKVDGLPAGRAHFHSVDADDLTLQVLSTISLASGQYVEVFVWNYTGSAVQTLGGAGNTEFMIVQMF